MRVMFDTNIFIATAIKSGLAGDMLNLATNSDIIRLITSEEVLTELKDKLLFKFERAETIVDIFLKRIRRIAEIVEITKRINVVKRDPQDNKILECALSGKADLIVSLDQDLIKLKQFKDIVIIHPKTLSWTFPEYFKKLS